MATNKNSFLLYCDIIHTVKKLPDEVAGKLFKHILSYVNDENPLTDDILIEIAFEPIKQALKRDLQKWDTYMGKQRDNGKKGGRPKKPIDIIETQETQAFSENPSQPKKPVSVIVSVSVIESVIEEKNLDSKFINLWGVWKDYKNSQFKFKYKSPESEKIGFDQLLKLSSSNVNTANLIIEQSIANGWAGLFELKNKNQSILNQTSNNLLKPTQRFYPSDRRPGVMIPLPA